MSTRRVVIYARLSITAEESVSISRQIEACRKYAEARGWEVVEVFTDDGVSATHNKPEDRKGWSDLVNYGPRYDAVVVWKIDRLARKVLDFLQADEALQGRKAGIVAVEDPVDMTTPQGRAFATMLAVFGEMEAAAIRARVKGAREYLIRNGRIPARMAPYGYRIVPNPEGKGKVLSQDPERIGYVREAAERVLKGETVNAVARWLNEVGAPTPGKSEQWGFSTVERMLANPTLAGMTPYNPGRGRNDAGTFTGVLRDETGMPVINESLAIITTDERRALVTALTNKPGGIPRASQNATSVFLAGLLTCGHCDRVMIRANLHGKASMKCPQCYQTISRGQLDPHIATRLLDERGQSMMWTGVEVEDTTPDVADIDEALEEISRQKRTASADERRTLSDREDALLELRDKALSQPDSYRIKARTGKRVSDAWRHADTDEAKREVLASQVERIVITRGKVGRNLDTSRVHITWAAEDLPLTAA